MTDKRKERRKKIIKRRIIKCFIVLIFIGIITFGVLAVTVLFPVREVFIKGSGIYTPEEILDASEITTNTNLLILNEEKLLETIRQKLPFTDSIKLDRMLPDKLNITVKDAKEYAAFKVGEEYYTISKKGYALAKYSEMPENVFIISANNVKLKIGKSVTIKEETAKTTLTDMVNSLNNEKIKIDYIDITDSLTLKAKVEGRFEVNFGTASNLDKKAAHLKGMLSDIGDKKTGKINLSMWSGEKTEGSFVEGSIK